LKLLNERTDHAVYMEVAKAVMPRHGGTIWCDETSQYGPSVFFSVSFPVIIEPLA
jgi:hypothetical protein